MYDDGSPSGKPLSPLSTDDYLSAQCGCADCNLPGRGELSCHGRENQLVLCGALERLRHTELLRPARSLRRNRVLRAVAAAAAVPTGEIAFADPNCLCRMSPHIEYHIASSILRMPICIRLSTLYVNTYMYLCKVLYGIADVYKYSAPLYLALRKLSIFTISRFR